jgi:hypothetical protein
MKNLILRTVGVAAMAALVSTAAHAQSKAGLWENTSTMKMEGMQQPQQPQIPPDVLAKMQAQGMKMPTFSSNGMTTKAKVCVTQETIDKWGGPQPHTDKDCSVNNVQRSSGGFSADIVCTGHMNGKGSVKATHVDSTHTTMAMHFSGTSDKGKPVEWNMEGSAVFLGTSCGDVQPGHPVLE